MMMQIDTNTPLSASELKYLDRSPAHLKEHRDNPVSSQAMVLGTAIHTAVLQPESFYKRYAVMDDEEICEKIGGIKPRATKEYRSYLIDFYAENEGKIIISKDDCTICCDIFEILRSHKITRRLLDAQGDVEKRINWNHTGINMTGQPDKVIYPCTDYLNGMIIDLKTSSRDSRHRAFQSDIWNFKYHLQAAAYTEAVKETQGHEMPFVFIAVESERPYGVGVYCLEQNDIDYALTEIDRLIKLYAECMNNNDWHGYKQELCNIELPSWSHTEN